MRHVKVVILGAGPSGLAFANKMKQDGSSSFIVLEKEKEAGGLCRSQIVDNYPLDTGGGHFLDTTRDKVLKFLFGFMPLSEWNLFERKSNIVLNDIHINYPFEANIWQFPIEEQIEYIESIIKAGCNSGKPMPNDFEEWIKWKLGDKIANEYMLPYNRKIWSLDLSRLGVYWLYKLPNVSLKDTLKSCLLKQPAGNLPAHSKFYYPKKYGYGELWRRMAEEIHKNIKYNYQIKTLDFENRVINDDIQCDFIVNTIPWMELTPNHTIPNEIKSDIQELEFTGIEIEYFKDNIDSDSHWTYIPEERKPYHRTLNRSNFIHGSTGYWTETNTKRILNNKINSPKYQNKYAYPLNTINKPEKIKNILKWAESKSVYGLGRWGEWEHMNSDVAVEKSMNLFELLQQKYNL